VNEIGAANDRWPVARDIFEDSYAKLGNGVYVKRPLTLLVPLVDITHDPNQIVKVSTLEGDVNVRAGDFYLARGIQGEIWPYPKDKADTTLVLVEYME
jgi:hypothetical protein